MKIIDNRYRIEGSIEEGLYYREYVVSDLWNGNERYKLRLYNSNFNEDMIEYYIDNFYYISTIKHKNLLNSLKFNLVSTIDAKKPNTMMYYSIGEYSDGRTLSESVGDLNLKERVKIVLSVLDAIDYLHFRGIIYASLMPENILIDGSKIKLSGISDIFEKIKYESFDEESLYFVSTDVFLGFNVENKNIDYHSISVLIKYLLFEEYPKSMKVKSKIELSVDQRYVLDNVLDKLMQKNIRTQTIDLREIMGELIRYFEVDYNFDSLKNRENLYFTTKLAGRSKETKKVSKLDERDRPTSNKGLVYFGEPGIGKTRFIDEMEHQLRYRGRNVYGVQVLKDSNQSLNYIGSLLKQSLKDAPKDLMDKYREELSRILPELRVSFEDDSKSLDFSKVSDVFRLYNRVTNYFKELSDSGLIYIIIDDLHYMESNGIAFLDYLIRNVGTDNILFLFTVDKDYAGDMDNNSYIEQWISEDLINSEKLHPLNEVEVKEMIENILGVSKVEGKFSSVINRESEGNPRYVEYLIKNLFSTKQLYIDEDGKWHISVDDYDELYFPVDMHDATNKQLEVIRAEYVDIFKVLSIFNEGVSRTILSKMLNRNSKDIFKEVGELIRLKLIDKRVVDWGYSYSISNPYIKKQIYNDIDEEERLELHKQAIIIIEDVMPSNTSLGDEYIHHLKKAGEKDKALNIILSRFERLENKYGTEALIYLEEAYRIISDENTLRKLNILKQIVKIYVTRDQLDTENIYLTEYVRVAEEKMIIDEIVDGKHIMSKVYAGKLNLKKAMELGKEIIKLSKEYDYIDGQIIGILITAKYNINIKTYDELNDIIYKLLDMSFDENSTKYLGEIYNLKGLNEFKHGNMISSLDSYNKSIDYSIENMKLVDIIDPINNIGKIYDEYFGNTDKAMENYEKGLRISEVYGLQDYEVLYLNDIGELYLKNFRYSDATPYITRAMEISVDIQNKDIIFLTNLNQARINLGLGQYEETFQLTKKLKYIYENNSIIKMDITGAYKNYLSLFHGTLGEWEDAIYYSEKAMETFEGFSIQQHLTNRGKVVLFKYLKDGEFNVEEMEKILQEYSRTTFREDHRVTNLIFALIASLMGDVNYSEDLLSRDDSFNGELNLSEYIKEIIRGINLPNLDNVDRIMELEGKIRVKGYHGIGLFMDRLILGKLYKVERYMDALRQAFENLDTIYKSSRKIPDYDHKKNFIKSRYGDYNKDIIKLVLKILFNKDVDYVSIENKSGPTINKYFNLNNIFEQLSNDELSLIANIDKSVSNIKTMEELVNNFGEDYLSNIKTILDYIAKETLANKGYVITYNDSRKSYEPIVSLNNNAEYKTNTNILNMVFKKKDGVLINNDIESVFNYGSAEVLFGEMNGLICYPIFNKSNVENKIEGYLYLETDRIFNRFDKKRMKVIERILPLLLLNLKSYKLEEMATVDKLTGTLTRKYYELRFKEILGRAEKYLDRFAVMMFDIDDFKHVNDTYGHLKGDEVLSILGSILRKHVTKKDVAARYGGEEFTVILTGESANKAIKVADDIRKDMENYRFPGIEKNITLSVGISFYPENGDEKDELVERADQALYYSKNNGKNRVSIWNKKMDQIGVRSDKLAGVITGNASEDNRNMLALLDIVNVIGKEVEFEEKVYLFLGKVLEVTGGEKATMLLPAEYRRGRNIFTREILKEGFRTTPKLNLGRISQVIANEKGDYLIDWDSFENVDKLSGLPNWESIILIPVFKGSTILGVTYISVPINIKEFTYNNYNIAEIFSRVFSTII